MKDGHIYNKENNHPQVYRGPMQPARKCNLI